MQDVVGLTQELAWRDAPSRAIALSEQCADVAKAAQDALRELPVEKVAVVYYAPGQRRFYADVVEDTQQKAAARLETIAPVTFRDTEELKAPVLYGLAREKYAWSRSLRGLGHAILAFPNPVSRNVPAGGSPLVSMLAGGLLGAGVGYGAGWLGEKAMPDKWQKGRLRRTLALLGGVGGMLPGGLGVATHLALGRSPLEVGDQFVEASPNRPAGAPLLSKQALSVGAGELGLLGAQDANWPPLDAVTFAHTLWRDPEVAGRLHPSQQAAASGLITGAAYKGGGTRLVTPLDVARMTAGMGSGYLSGWLVGKALGALTGMPQETQNRLKTTGMWAGVVANLLPAAFGVR